jgi:hypothetical protein
VVKNSTKKGDASSKTLIKKTIIDSDSSANAMNDPSYLRQSSALINEALKKGFDVLQLANGDIVTTGTKTIVNQYVWDVEKAKLVKAKTSAKIGDEEIYSDEKIFANEAEEA